ncbi:MAG: aldehyde dehydrogenase family protein [Hyphomicrobiales bacterium]
MSKLSCISPIDGSVYTERDIQSVSEVKAIVAKARDAQKLWAEVDVADRVKIVDAAINALEVMNGEIVIELAHLMGRPVRYGGEIGGVKERAFHMSSIGQATLQPTVIENSDEFNRYIAKEPVSVVLTIAPWNYPFLTAVNSMIPALVAGNAVVLKHSTQTITAGEYFAKAFAIAGLPDGLFSTIFVSHDVSNDLIESRTFDYISFTGSVGGGKQVERAAAGTFVGVGLELGGKDPGYVRADANLDAAVDTLIDGAMFNSGQCCCGIERIYVHESLFEEFVAKAKTIVDGYTLGNPLDEATTLGPMANKRFADEVRAQISEALDAGATSVIDRTKFTRDTGDDAYLAPEILINVDHSMRVMKDESFGPVVGIMKVSSDEEAIRLMNDSEFGLTASIWTADVDAAEKIGRQIETGTIYMNRCDYLDPALCWTGCKDTGRGISLSAFGYDSVTRAKSYHLKKK